MTYDEQVRIIAEEMAISHYLKHPEEREMRYFAVSFSELQATEKEKLIHLKRNDARIAVKHMAEAVRIACAVHYDVGDEHTIETYLIEQGLIPNQEGGKDETI